MDSRSRFVVICNLRWTVLTAIAFLAFLLAAHLSLAQSASQDQNLSNNEVPPTGDMKGFSLFEEFHGSAGSSGQFLVLDSALEYDFNNHFGMGVGLPVYFLHPDTSALGQSEPWQNHSGDPYLDLRLTLDKPILSYATVLSLSVPTSSAGLFSTGKVGVNWFNHFERPVKRFVPFVNAGIGNGALASYVLSQPFRLSQTYTPYGFVADFEGGTLFRLSQRWGLGGLYYVLVPCGHQTVLASGPSDSSSQAIDVSQLTHDDGLSAFVRLIPTPYLYAQVGYVHSVKLSQDAATFIVGVDVLALARRSRAQSQ